MAQRIQRLCSIKGVGFQTALSLSCLLPEIGSISTKQLAALVGVAPFVRDSGPRCAKRSIRGAEPNFVLNFIWLLCLPVALTQSFAMSTSV